jgi:hypothetical protein
MQSTAVRELTLNDRCDACSAASNVIATFLIGDLIFCGHHAKEKHTDLIKKALEVYDPEGVFSS